MIPGLDWIKKNANSLSKLHKLNTKFYYSKLRKKADEKFYNYVTKESKITD